MIHLKKEDMNKIAGLFEGWEETPIWSCLQGYMGNAWAYGRPDEDKEAYKSAQIITGDLCFFAGVPNIELIRNIPDDFPSENIIMVPQNEEWGNMIQRIYEDGVRISRYAFKKEPEAFNRDLLAGYVKELPEGYELRRIDEEIYNRVKAKEWSKDLCSQFPTYSAYEKMGVGIAALYNGEIASGASSYTVYDKGIEIEIDTASEHRRKGLALACASRLILECLDRGLYPSWDAANLQSVALAEKLGYHLDGEYTAFLVPARRDSNKAK